MSRGHGALQRRVLERLAANTANPLDDEREAGVHTNPDAYRFGYHAVGPCASWTMLADLAVDGTHSSVESARRAVLRLADDGVVQTAWVGRRLAARLTPDAATVAAITAIREERKAEHDAAVDTYRAERKAVRTARMDAEAAKRRAHREAARLARNARRRAKRAVQGRA